MQKIIPHLWFDHQAEEAIELYQSIFKNSKTLQVNRYLEENANIAGMEKDTVMSVNFVLDGQDFIALNGGPVFQFTPAISFYVNCDTREELNEMWVRFTEGGSVLMELNQYPFSELFGWVQDKYGVNWQLNLGGRKQKITPFFMFTGTQSGKAEAAINFYTSLFQNSTIKKIERFEKGEGNAEGTLKHAVFSLDGQEFMAIDSNFDHKFNFTEAISLFVNCEDQEEVDTFWEKLTEGGEEVQCGWLKDKYGISWQIVPSALGEILGDQDAQKSQRAMNQLLQMKKIDILKLLEA